ncbi:FkbM family methyltransferase [Mucilaginibacter arboris]|uniref:FkbM family methyltransferase n=1 Tax=Mucilaginibacter arboris TaxID=2682090 RepID=UPI0018DE0EDF|nr:FkbM family methyltransferase [Mucilaginibacter arboris]
MERFMDRRKRRDCKQISERFRNLLEAGRLKIKHAFINAENIESLFDEANAPAEPDLLSIDIDYNDYHVWQAITKYKPRVVIIEYNSIFRPDTHFVVKYNPKRMWDKTSHFGTSLLALEQLGNQKGYCLVGCVFTGSNAFFVREDLVGDLFESPYSAENHYEPNRDYLYYKAGHPKNHIPD